MRSCDTEKYNFSCARSSSIVTDTYSVGSNSVHPRRAQPTGRRQLETPFWLARAYEGLLIHANHKQNDLGANPNRQYYDKSYLLPSPLPNSEMGYRNWLIPNYKFRWLY